MTEAKNLEPDPREGAGASGDGLSPFPYIDLRHLFHMKQV